MGCAEPDTREPATSPCDANSQFECSFLLNCYVVLDVLELQAGLGVDSAGFDSVAGFDSLAGFDSPPSPAGFSAAPDDPPFGA